MRPLHAAVRLVLLLLFSAASGAAEVASLVDVDVLPGTSDRWVARLQLSGSGFEVSGVALDGTRFYVDITPATWPGSPIQRRSDGGVTTYRWARFASSPPTLRFAVEHRPDWHCASKTRGATVEVSCRTGKTGPAESDACRPLALVRGLSLCTPLRGLTGADILARSLEYLPKDVIHDGLPHFGATRDDWKDQSRPHQGLDIYVDDRDVLAMASGRVAGIGIGEKAGGWIKIAHDSGVVTVYVHVRRIFVTQGEAVRQGEIIGRVSGAVGNAIEAQLHLGIRLDGAPVDPAPLFMDAAPAELKQDWKRAISSIPQRVVARQRKIEAQER